MLKLIKSDWVGILLSTMIVVAIVWLSINEKLIFYINPDHIWFGIFMSVITLIALATVAYVKTSPSFTKELAEHSHDDEKIEELLQQSSNKAQEKSSKNRGLSELFGGLGVLGVVVLTLIGTLVLPPAALSASAADNRGVNTNLGQLSLDFDPNNVNNIPYDSFDIADWALWISQSADLNLITGVQLEQLGFVSEDPNGNPDRFFLTRFLITHCAIDAVPLGIPIRYENWQTEFSAGDWVRAKGEFFEAAVTEPVKVELNPSELELSSEPNQPYVF